MDQRDRIDNFVGEVSAMLQTVARVQEQVSQARAELQIARTVEPARASEVERMLAQGLEVLGRIGDVTCQRARRSDLHQVRELIRDLTIRMEAADEYHQQWRRAHARLELAVRQEEVAPEDRAEYEAHLTKQRQKYEAQLELAAELVPAVPSPESGLVTAFGGAAGPATYGPGGVVLGARVR
jgi:hypothetical protein